MQFSALSNATFRFSNLQVGMYTIQLSVPGYEINPTNVYIQDPHTVRMYGLRINVTSNAENGHNNNMYMLAAPNLDEGSALVTLIWDSDYPDVSLSVSTPYGCVVDPVNRVCTWADSMSATMTVPAGTLGAVNVNNNDDHGDSHVDGSGDGGYMAAFKSVYVRQMVSGDYSMYVNRLGEGARRIMRTRATVLVFLPGTSHVYVCSRFPLSGFQFPVLGCRFPVPGFRLPVLGSRFPVPGFRLPVSSSRFRFRLNSRNI